MAEVQFIGIKRLWYANVITTEMTTASLVALLKDTATKEVKNSHQDTFEYNQDDPDITDYINELTGKPYYRDMTSEGAKTITFTIGSYDFNDKVALQGGSLIEDGGNVVGWSAPDNPQIIYKSIIAQTKTGHFVVFTKAGVVGKTTMADKNMGLGVTATCMDNPALGVKDEYWFDGGKVELTAKQSGE